MGTSVRQEGTPAADFGEVSGQFDTFLECLRQYAYWLRAPGPGGNYSSLNYWLSLPALGFPSVTWALMFTSGFALTKLI